MLRFYLSIVAIFKNEKEILTEWLEHHHRQGVEHFYLIDNGSTDDYQTAIAPYRHLIDLVVDPQRYQQPDHYNRHFLKKSKTESEWIMVIDLDEFVYATQRNRTIADYLRSLDDTIGQIYIPWKEYGSNGHLQTPPFPPFPPPHGNGGCLTNFIRRKLYSNETQTHTKTITRTRYLTRMWIHHSFIQTDRAKEITSDGRPRPTAATPAPAPAPALPYMAPISEAILKRSALHCNHYYSRSFEWYRQVKMTRGSASAQSDEKDLSVNRFNQWNRETNQVVDRPPCPSGSVTKTLQFR
jgi:hypothetical protein